MKKISKISASFLIVASISCVFWTGSYLLRMILSYQLFDETITSYRGFINEQNLNAILISLNPAVLTTSVLFVVFLVFFFLFLLTSKLKLRKNGWLFIITILVVVTAPFEIYLLTIDYQIFSLVHSGIFQGSEVMVLLMRRLKELSSFPFIEILSYCTIIFLAIFKPMTREEL